ncbi:MAG: Rpn family recombination-promoting nuclease/putative transposase [Chlamydiae bacterium]|nr:Rpn family recombination-promoting nuclease/putative transposase [Chlamydiota bacterium]
MSKYLDPKAGIVFKKIFGNHPHLLKSFLNAVLPLAPDRKIVSLEYLSGEQIPHAPAFKYTVVDVKCKDEKGQVFIVEMQMDWVSNFKQRMLFNTASAFVRQLHRGEEYQFLCPIYGLGIIADTFDQTSPAWYHHYQIVNIHDTLLRIEGLELVFLELPKFQPSTQDDKRLIVLWLRFLLELGDKTRELPPEFLAVPEIKEACALSEEAAYTEAELEGYHAYWDRVSTEKTLIRGKLEAGEKIGFEKGKAAGLEEGKAVGLEEGKALGKEELKAAIAKKMLSTNPHLTLEQIASLLDV